MRTIGRPLYKTIGRVIGKGAHLGSLLNYLKLFFTYKTRVEDDSGTVNNDTITKDAFKNLPAQESIVFAWLGGAGSKKRTSTIYKFFTNLYSLFGTNDATQTTESSQPYVSGNIAPNEVEGLKSPNEDIRYMTFSEINFTETQGWSVTVIMQDFYDSGRAVNSGYYFLRSNSGNSLFGLQGRGYYTFRSESNVLFSYTTDYFQKERGKNNIITLIGNNGTVKVYSNNELIGTTTSASDFSISQLNIEAYSIPTTYSGLIIRGEALTADQVASEHALLREIYPEIPSVQIGTYDIATSNLEMVASTDGTLITQATDNADWATGAARWCYHNADSAVGAIYGKLYNKAARDVIIANPPDGWHVATEAELTTIAASGGNALKIAGTDYWTTTGGTNTTGFSAIGGSSRNADGTFNSIKDHAGFWCADSDKVLKVYHDSDTAEVVAVTSVNEGFSIRLIKDSE